MKKLFLIASFSIAIMANATEKTNVVKNDHKQQNQVTFENLQNSEAFFFGCGSQGNSYYNRLMETGDYTHREARSARRAFVRDCRGGKWWEVCVFGLCI